MPENEALESTACAADELLDSYGSEESEAISEFCADEPSSNPYCDLLSQIVEDVTVNSESPIPPDLAESLAMNMPYARSVFLQYLAAKGSVEERLRQAVLVSVPALQ